MLLYRIVHTYLPFQTRVSVYYRSNTFHITDYQNYIFHKISAELQADELFLLNAGFANAQD